MSRKKITWNATQKNLARNHILYGCFYAAHRDAVLDFGPVALGRMQGLIYRRLQKIVAQNLSALTTEIKETGELTVLLAAASVRPLTAEESRKV